MSSETLDALDAYHQASRALRAAIPGTAQWVRLRMIVQERRIEYERRLDAEERAPTSPWARNTEPERTVVES